MMVHGYIFILVIYYCNTFSAIPWDFFGQTRIKKYERRRHNMCSPPCFDWDWIAKLAAVRQTAPRTSKRLVEPVWGVVPLTPRSNVMSSCPEELLSDQTKATTRGLRHEDIAFRAAASGCPRTIL